MDQTDPPFAQPVMQLAYADLPARHGIIFERTGTGSCMISVPVSMWQQLFYSLGGGVLVMFLVHPLVGLILTIVGVILVITKVRLGKPMVFQLTPEELVIENIMNPHEDPSDVRSTTGEVRYDRRDIYDLKYVGHSNRIVIHARGHQMLELCPSRDRKVLQWIADTLREELWSKSSPPSIPTT